MKGLLALAILLAAPLPAEEPQRFERLEGELLTVDLTLKLVDPKTSTVRDVAPTHRFKAGDRLTFEMLATRGGYVAIETGEGERLWPRSGPGQPVQAKTAIRLPLPDAPPIRIVDPGPTNITLVFALRPADGPTRPRLKQIRLRGAVLDDAPPDRPPPLRFEGKVSDGEAVAMPIVLQHAE